MDCLAIQLMEIKVERENNYLNMSILDRMMMVTLKEILIICLDKLRMFMLDWKKFKEEFKMFMNLRGREEEMKVVAN